MKTYKTHEIARLTGIHPNTVRLYERVGLITPPERLKNGYRVYTELHLRQVLLARTALRAEVLMNGLRKKAVEAVKLCAALDFTGAEKTVEQYEEMILREIAVAKTAVSSVESMLNGNGFNNLQPLLRKDAALKICVTVDTLRNWERNGLITAKRMKNGYRFFGQDDINRLLIIRTLRCANYSLSSILRLVSSLSKNSNTPVLETLNTPSADEDIVSACDKLIVSLENTLKDARQMKSILEEIKKTNPTLKHQP